MEHQISELMKISMNSIRDLVDVNIIIGDAIKTGVATIIPVSKVKCGFVSGGIDQKKGKMDDTGKPPFGGGACANLSIVPVAFLVCQDDEVRVLHLEENSHIFEKLIDLVPDVIEKIKGNFQKDPVVYEVVKE